MAEAKEKPPVRVKPLPGVASGRYVQPWLFELLTGYSPRAVEGKIARGDWVEGREYKKAPDGKILVDMEGFNRWVERPGQEG